MLKLEFKLEDLLEEDEVIVDYHLTQEHCFRNCIVIKGKYDINGALEDTLHRILEAGADGLDVYKIMGAYIPSEEELKELDEFGAYIPVDLGYVIPGLIDIWKEKEVD